MYDLVVCILFSAALLSLCFSANIRRATIKSGSSPVTMISIYQLVSCPCALTIVGRKEKGKKVLMEIYRPERCEIETPVAFRRTPVSVRWKRNQLVWQTRGRKELFGVFYQLIKCRVRLIRHEEVNAKEMEPSRNDRSPYAHTETNKCHAKIALNVD